MGIKLQQCQPVYHDGRIHRKETLTFSSSFSLEDRNASDETLVTISGTLGLNTGSLFSKLLSDGETIAQGLEVANNVGSGTFSAVAVDIDVSLISSSSIKHNRFEGLAVHDGSTGRIGSSSFIKDSSADDIDSLFVSSSNNTLFVTASGPVNSLTRTFAFSDAIDFPQPSIIQGSSLTGVDILGAENIMHLWTPDTIVVSGSKVSQWTSIGTRGLDLIQTSPTQRPDYVEEGGDGPMGKPYIKFTKDTPPGQGILATDSETYPRYFNSMMVLRIRSQPPSPNVDYLYQLTDEPSRHLVLMFNDQYLLYPGPTSLALAGVTTGSWFFFETYTDNGISGSVSASIGIVTPTGNVEQGGYTPIVMENTTVRLGRHDVSSSIPNVDVAFWCVREGSTRLSQTERDAMRPFFEDQYGVTIPDEP